MMLWWYLDLSMIFLFKFDPTYCVFPGKLVVDRAPAPLPDVFMQIKAIKTARHKKGITSNQQAILTGFSRHYATPINR